MVKGVHLSRESKYLVYVHSVLRGRSHAWIHHEIFLDSDKACDRGYLASRCTWLQRRFREDAHHEIVSYIVGGRKRGGRPRRMSHADDMLIEAIIRQHDDLTDKEIATLFGLVKSANPSLIGATLVRRSRLRTDNVMLTYDRTHVACDEAKMKIHYQILASVHEDDIINFDEVRRLPNAHVPLFFLSHIADQL